MENKGKTGEMAANFKVHITNFQSPYIYVICFIASYGFKLFSLVTEKMKYEMQRDGAGEN